MVIVAILILLPISYWLVVRRTGAWRLFVSHDRAYRPRFLLSVIGLHITWAAICVLVFCEVRVQLEYNSLRLIVAVVFLLVVGLGLAAYKPPTSERGTSLVVAAMLPVTGNERYAHVLIVLVAAFCEELVFRLSAIHALHHLTRSLALAAVVSSASFTLIHGRSAMSKFGVYLFLKGCVYATMFILSKSILWPFLLHAVTDLFLLIRPVPASVTALPMTRRDG